MTKHEHQQCNAMQCNTMQCIDLKVVKLQSENENVKIIRKQEWRHTTTHRRLLEHGHRRARAFARTSQRSQTSLLLFVICYLFPSLALYSSSFVYASEPESFDHKEYEKKKKSVT